MKKVLFSIVAVLALMVSTSASAQNTFELTGSNVKKIHYGEYETTVLLPQQPNQEMIVNVVSRNGSTIIPWNIMAAGAEIRVTKLSNTQFKIKYVGGGYQYGCSLALLQEGVTGEGLSMWVWFQK